MHKEQDDFHICTSSRTDDCDEKLVQAFQIAITFIKLQFQVYVHGSCSTFYVKSAI